MKFSVPDMSCGHCRAAVERAIGAQDAGAQVSVDLAAHEVTVQTGLAPDVARAALGAEGYPARQIG